MPSADKDRDREREGGGNGRSDRPHERGARRDRNPDGSRNTPSSGDTNDKRRDKRDRNDDRATNGNGSGHRHDNAPTSPSSRPPPTGPRSERDRGGRDDAPHSLADRLAPPSPLRGENGNDRWGDRGRGRESSPPGNNGDGTLTPPAGDANDSSSRKRSGGEAPRALFDHALGSATGNSKRIKIDRKRRLTTKESG